MMRRGFALGIGCCALIAALIRPGPVVRWLARKHPDVLFSLETTEPVVALTIDDSPHPTATPRILDALAAHGARATFFLIGDRIPGNEAIVRRIVAEGHELGNHLMTNAPSIWLSPEEFERQLRQMDELLSPYGAVRWFRPGMGWFSRRMLDQVRNHGYRCALGSAYAYDPHIRSPWYVSRHISLNIGPGGVIILHDGAASGGCTVTVLGEVLPRLRQRGYRVVTLSELAAVDESARSGSSFRPSARLPSPTRS